MVNVDEKLSLFDAGANFAEPFETGRVGRDDAIKFHASFRLLDQTVGIQKLIFFRNPVFVPAMDFFAFVFVREGQSQLRTDAIAIGTNMPDDAYGMTFADAFYDAINDLGMRIHFLRLRTERIDPM